MLSYIAFDPGLKGGIAVAAMCANDEPWDTYAEAMPIAGKEIDCEAIAKTLTILKEYGNVIAIIEKVGAMPGQGVTSMFTFGKGYGTLIGICGGLGVRVELVTPQAWKKVVLAGTAKDKDAAIAYCRRAFPDISLLRTSSCKTPSDGIADALCILEYGKRTYVN